MHSKYCEVRVQPFPTRKCTCPIYNAVSAGNEAHTVDMRPETIVLLLTALTGAYAQVQEPGAFGTYVNSALNLVTLGSNQYIFVMRPASWFDALTFCNAHGMDLVNIETQQENTLLAQHLGTLGLATDRVYNIWTSGTKLGRSRWMWLNGANIDFTDWVEGEPSSPKSEDCLGLWVRNGREVGWNDAVCSTVEAGFLTGFICERWPVTQ